VVRRAPGDRNFHAFHQLVAAFRAGHELTKDIGLDGYIKDDPALFSQEAVDNDMYSEDVEAFNKTCKAMETMGIYEDDQRRVWRVVSVVLALGEMQFQVKATEDKSAMPHSQVLKGLCFF